MSEALFDSRVLISYTHIHTHIHIIQDGFRWENLRNDLSTDAVFGSNFQWTRDADPPIITKPSTIFQE